MRPKGGVFPSSLSPVQTSVAIVMSNQAYTQGEPGGMTQHSTLQINAATATTVSMTAFCLLLPRKCRVGRRP